MRPEDADRETPPGRRTDRRTVLKTTGALGGGFLLGGRYAATDAAASCGKTTSWNWGLDDNYEWQCNGNDKEVNVTVGVSHLQTEKVTSTGGTCGEEYWEHRYGVMGVTACAADLSGDIYGLAALREGGDQHVDIDAVTEPSNCPELLELHEARLLDWDGSTTTDLYQTNHYREDDDPDTFCGVVDVAEDWASQEGVDLQAEFDEKNLLLGGVGAVGGWLASTSPWGALLAAVTGIPTFVDGFNQTALDDEAYCTFDDTCIGLESPLDNDALAMQYVDFTARVPPNTSYDIEINQFFALDDSGFCPVDIDGNVRNSFCYRVHVPSNDWSTTVGNADTGFAFECSSPFQ